LPASIGAGLLAALELVTGAFISGMAARDAAPVTAATAVPNAAWCMFFAMFPPMPRKATILALVFAILPATLRNLGPGHLHHQDRPLWRCPDREDPQSGAFYSYFADVPYCTDSTVAQYQVNGMTMKGKAAWDGDSIVTESVLRSRRHHPQAHDAFGGWKDADMPRFHWHSHRRARVRPRVLQGVSRRG
jgi:hypothetical protein